MTSDLEAPSVLGSVKPLDLSVVTSALAEDSDEDLPAPGALPAATKKKAAALESLLNEETEREKQEREAMVESEEQLDLRTFWRPSKMWSIDQQDKAQYVGDGWRGQIAQALRGKPSHPCASPNEADSPSAFRRHLHVVHALPVGRHAILATEFGRDRFSRRPPSRVPLDHRTA